MLSSRKNFRWFLQFSKAHKQERNDRKKFNFSKKMCRPKCCHFHSPVIRSQVSSLAVVEAAFTRVLARCSFLFYCFARNNDASVREQASPKRVGKRQKRWNCYRTETHLSNGSGKAGAVPIRPPTLAFTYKGSAESLQMLTKHDIRR